jgi:hypothetical protein
VNSTSFGYVSNARPPCLQCIQCRWRATPCTLVNLVQVSRLSSQQAKGALITLARLRFCQSFCRSRWCITAALEGFYSVVRVLCSYYFQDTLQACRLTTANCYLFIACIELRHSHTSWRYASCALLCISSPGCSFSSTFFSPMQALPSHTSSNLGRIAIKINSLGRIL